MPPRLVPPAAALLATLLLTPLAAAQRRAPPAPEDIARAYREVILPAYDRLEQTHDRTRLAELARTVLTDSGEHSPSEGALHFAMLDTAWRTAARAHAVAVGLDAIDELTRVYETDADVLAGELLGTISKDRPDADTARQCLTPLAHMAGRAWLDDDAPTLRVVLDLTGRLALTARAEGARDLANRLLAALPERSDDRATPIAEFADPLAALLGALAPQEWERVLVVMARSRDAQLSGLVGLERRGARDVEAGLLIADSYWRVARTTRDPATRQVWELRAAMWYRDALEHAGGIRRRLANQRIAQATARIELPARENPPLRAREIAPDEGREPYQPPSGDDLAAADALLDETYGAHLDTHESDDLAQALATLLADATSERVGSALHYRALQCVADRAPEAGEFEIGLEAIERLGRHYRLDPSPLRLSLCRGFAKNSRSGSENGEAALCVLASELLAAASRDDRETLETILEIAPRLASAADRKPATKLLDALSDRDGRSLRKPRRDATDRHAPATLAALAVCMDPGAWDAAMPLLATSDDERLRAALAKEPATGQTAADPKALAVAWQELNEAVHPDPEAWAWGLRALHWHRVVLEQPGVREVYRRRAENQIKTLELRLGLAANIVRITSDPIDAEDSPVEPGQESRPVEADAPRRGPPAPRLPLGDQLLENGSGDARRDSLPGWVAESGEWQPRLSGGAKDPHERNGRFIGLGPNMKFKRADLRQDVELSRWARRIDAGEARVELSAWVAAYAQPPGDQARISLRFLDDAGAPIGEQVDSQWVHSRTWRQLTISEDVPEGTRRIQIVLGANRGRGPGQTDNNAYFDDVQLQFVKR